MADIATAYEFTRRGTALAVREKSVVEIAPGLGKPAIL
ncbi:hypothetical protein EKH55_5027 [Sinorhizobium alkalisoli]|nr:hypothetical protein EKH55_5027 [Sinorhizobium alkalisoli]